MQWFTDHGHKLLAALTTLLTAVNGLDPALASKLEGTGAKPWEVAFLLAAGTLLHSLFIKPAARDPGRT